MPHTALPQVTKDRRQMAASAYRFVFPVLQVGVRHCLTLQVHEVL